MNFLTVNESKCRHDGICAAVCPVGILVLDPQKNIPVPAADAQERCVNCGHCAAVCPQAALSLAAMPATQCLPLPDGWNLSPAQVSAFLKGRRSIRCYKKDLVDREIIEKLIDTARYAPSGINLQPVAWKILYDPQKLAELAGLVVAWMKTQIASQSPLALGLKFDRIVAAWEKGEDRICRNAPHLVVAYGLKDDPTAPQAATIAITYLDLIAAAHGLGACWAGYVHIAASQDPAVKKFLGLRSREACLGAMLLGFPRHRYYRIPLRNPARLSWI